MSISYWYISSPVVLKDGQNYADDSFLGNHSSPTNCLYYLITLIIAFLLKNVFSPHRKDATFAS